MSCPHHPPKLLDYVVDFLHDSIDVLESCCLVSKSWIPRTRKHLFDRIRFYNASNLELWNTMFRDPSTSSARYTKTLAIDCDIIAAAGTGEGCCLSLSAFSQVTYLAIDVDGKSTVSPSPFHAFPPGLESLNMVDYTLPVSQIFDLIHSFPLLQDVSVDMFDRDDRALNEQPITISPSSSSAFTGSLKLHLRVGMGLIVSRLLSLPNGLYFRRLDLTWNHVTDAVFTTVLVNECCSTLESLRIHGERIGERVGSSGLEAWANLNKATKLKDMTFGLWRYPRWLLTTLSTVTRDHRELRQITLAMISFIAIGDPRCVSIRVLLGETVYQEWLELDRLLVQLCELHSIRLEVVDETYEMRTRMKVLLPQVMAREGGWPGRGDDEFED